MSAITAEDWASHDQYENGPNTSTESMEDSTNGIARVTSCERVGRTVYYLSDDSNMICFLYVYTKIII